MVDFNQLLISDDFKNIHIDVNINSSAQYSGFYIDKIYVEYYKNMNSIGVPSEKAAVAFSGAGTSIRSYSGNFNILSMEEADPSVQTFEGGLFYVIVVCRNGYRGSTSVARDIASVFDMHVVHKLGMGAIANFSSWCNEGRCSVSDKLEQFILVWHSLEFAVKSGDISQVNKLWTRFISFGNSNIKSGCNCGRL